MIAKDELTGDIGESLEGLYVFDSPWCSSFFHGFDVGGVHADHTGGDEESHICGRFCVKTTFLGFE